MRYILAFALVLFSLSLISCRGSAQSDEAPEVKITLTVEPQPATIGPATVIISLTNVDDDPINDADVRIRGDMTHAGMVPVLADTASSQDGVYKVPFEWTMAGDWSVTVMVVLPDGRAVTREFKVVVASGR